MLSGTRAEVEKLHELAVENDRLSKEKAAKYWDAAHKAKECELEVGDLVLYKWARPRKSMPLWDPVMYEVVERKGSMVTAARNGHSVTRNSSFFKFWSTGEQNNRPVELVNLTPEAIKTEPVRPAEHEVVRHTAVEQVASQESNQTFERQTIPSEILAEVEIDDTAPLEVEPVRTAVEQASVSNSERRVEETAKKDRPTKAQQEVRNKERAETLKA